MHIELIASPVHDRYTACAKTVMLQAVIDYKMKPNVVFLEGVM